MGFWDAAKAPVINDVATNLVNVPAFVRGNHPATLSEDFKEAIKKHYSDLQPLHVPDRDAAAVFAAAKRAVAVMPRATIVHESESEGVLEVVDVTALMRFRDDMVVRVCQEGAGCIVDVRSASRLGKGDLGKNAARIREYLGALRKELGLP